MTPQIRYPNITGKTPEEQIVQMRSYLHQLVDQLNWLFSVMGDANKKAEEEK